MKFREYLNESNELDTLKAVMINIAPYRDSLENKPRKYWVIQNTKTKKIMAKAFNDYKKFSSDPSIKPDKNGKIDSENQIKKIKQLGIKINNIKWVSIPKRMEDTGIKKG